LNAFNASNVKYLLIGGHAVMHYTEPRFTKDLDLWIEASLENGAAVDGEPGPSARLAGLLPRIRADCR